MLKKHSVTIRGHATSFSIEDDFHDELAVIAQRRGVPMARLIATIDARRDEATNLSSAIRLFVLGEVKKAGRS
jgi:predicted DNA-binding ribbon-helix-helix protein